MVITKLDKDDAVYAPIAVDGTAITVGVKDNAITFDAKDYWGPEQGIVDVYTHGPGEPLVLEHGDKNGGVYNVATVVIPAQKTEAVEAGTKTNEQTGKEETVIKLETEPLDMEAIQATLWPLPFEIAAPQSTETKEEA